MGLLSLLPGAPEHGGDRPRTVEDRARAERASRDAPDFLPVLQRELLDVIGRYVEIREDVIRVNLGRSGDTSLLEINVEIDGAKVKPTKNGAAGDSKAAAPRIDPGAATPWVKPS
jgi:cell division topological specificity factor MinE